jgi:hypothetical protein
MQTGMAGIGSYLPYMQGAQTATTAGAGMLGQGANILQGADTRSQFLTAQQAAQHAGTPISQMGGLAFAAGQGAPLLGGAASDIEQAQRMAQQYSQAELGPYQQMMLQSAAQAGAAGPQFGGAQQQLGQATTLGQSAAEQARLAAQGTNLAPIEQMMSQSAAQARMAGPQFGAAQQQLMGGANLGFGAAQQAALAAQQPGFRSAEQALGQGIGSLTGAARGFSPSDVQSFMNPYQQQVIDESIRQINRQGDIARQGLQAQAVRSGAFGGSREGVQRAELERGLSETRNAAIVGGLSQGYQSAAQQAQQAFEQQQQRQLAQAQGFQGVAGQAGSLAAQQAGLGQQAAQQLAQAGQMGMQAGSQLGSLEAQRAQQALAAEQYGGNIAQQLAAQRFQQAGLGQQAAQQQAQAAQLGLQAGSQLGTMEAQRAAQAFSAAQYGGNVAQQLAAQQFQQAGLGQQGAGLYGNLAQQQAALASQYGNIAQQQAGILGQQAGLGQAQAGLYGNLAQQQFGIGSQLGQGLGSLGSQLTAAGMQQGQLGGMMQGLGQQDVNFQYGLGSIQQQQKQRELDALRATQLQTAYQPYQQLAFTSDIYKGAPSSQMAMTTQAAPTPSPFQQIAGLATGALATAGAVKQAGGLF